MWYLNSNVGKHDGLFTPTVRRRAFYKVSYAFVTPGVSVVSPNHWGTNSDKINIQILSEVAYFFTLSDKYYRLGLGMC